MNFAVVVGEGLFAVRNAIMNWCCIKEFVSYFSKVIQACMALKGLINYNASQSHLIWINCAVQPID